MFQTGTIFESRDRDSRRSFLRRVGLLGAAAPAVSGLAVLGIVPDALARSNEHVDGRAGERAGQPSRAAEEAKRSVWSQEYWAQRGDIKLYMFRKRAGAPKAGEPAMPVLFLVHGSSISSRPSFDLSVP